MSEFDISTVFTIKCRNCDFGVERDTAGEAEDAAKDHLDDWDHSKYGYINYRHELIITSAVVVRMRIS